MNNLRIILCILFWAIFDGGTSFAQLALDSGVFVEGLWCFPGVNKPNEFRYLPKEAVVALDEEMHPNFFLFTVCKK